MFHIISTRELQSNIGRISDGLEKNAYIVTKRGHGKMLILPYFDGCDEFIDEYLEDYEMFRERENLEEELEESYNSGRSNLII